jgi:hypothetical protein
MAFHLYSAKVLQAAIPHAPLGTASEPLHGQAQRREESESRFALSSAARVAARGKRPVNLSRRLYGGLTIEEALVAAGIPIPA